jgi:hypothetical protein
MCRAGDDPRRMILSASFNLIVRQVLLRAQYRSVVCTDECPNESSATDSQDITDKKTGLADAAPCL